MKLPLLQVLESRYQKVKIKRLWAVKVIIICMGLAVFLGSQGLVERILLGALDVRSSHNDPKTRQAILRTMTRITTQGRFSDLTISMATEVLPEPELPAIPMMLKSCHGGEYLTSGTSE